MHQLAALRPYVTAGVAVVGAGLIAVTPVVVNDVESTLQHHAVDLVVSDVVNPIQTWLDVFTTAATALPQIYAAWAQTPAALAQQVLANWAFFGGEYVGPYQQSANNAVDYFLSVDQLGLFGGLITAFQDFASGQMVNGMQELWNTLVVEPGFNIGFPLIDTNFVYEGITQNLANFTKFLYTFEFGFGQSVLGSGGAVMRAMGASLQAAYDAWGAGDVPAALTNLLNTPGVGAEEFVQQWLVTGQTTADLQLLLVNYPQQLASDLVVPSPKFGFPAGPDILGGDSLREVLQAFSLQLVSGWPSLSSIINDLITLPGRLLDIAGISSPAAASGMTDFANVALMPADIATLLGGLGADLTTALNPAALMSMLPF